jgi:hypothetical protein
VQQRTRPATDVEHRLCGHHQWQVEAEVPAWLKRAKQVIQLRETGIGELAIDHLACLPDAFDDRNAVSVILRRHAEESHASASRS